MLQGRELWLEHLHLEEQSLQGSILLSASRGLTRSRVDLFCASAGTVRHELLMFLFVLQAKTLTALCSRLSFHGV